jgi:hypothetical protein
MGPTVGASGALTSEEPGSALQRIRILLPTAAPPPEARSTTFDLGRPLCGTTVGIRLDPTWRSYFTVVDEWKRLLDRDGARPSVLWTGDRVGAEGERTRSDLDDWSRLVDCGVIGLGN